MDTAVIGARITGLAPAVRLVSQGHHVTIFEKNGKVGGRMNQPKKDGSTLGLGPAIVMVSDVYKAIFEECGKRFKNYIDMYQLSYIFDIYFSDKDKVSVSTDLSQLSQTLKVVEPGSTHGFMSFLADVYKCYGIARKYLLECTFCEPSKFYNPIALYRDMKLRTLGKANHLVDSYVRNEKIRKLPTFQTLYVGTDPKQGPSTYPITPMIEMVHGVYYIKGGIYSLDKGLHRPTQDLGVSIGLNPDVQEIIIDPKFKRMDGLRVNGDICRFDKILCIADFPYAVQHLIPSHSPLKKYTPAKISKADYSCSVFLIYTGINRDLEDKVHLHNVIFAEGSRGNIDDILKGRLPKDLSIYLCSPSVEDEELAPEGKTSTYILIPAPELKTGQTDWDNLVIIEQVKNEIHEETEIVESPEGLYNDIISETIFTPLDFEAHYNVKSGTAFGLIPTLAQSDYYCSPNVPRNHKDLYSIGVSAHPGAGAPIVLVSTKATAEATLEDVENMK